MADASRYPDRDALTVTVAEELLVSPVTVTTCDERDTLPDDDVTLKVWEVSEFRFVMLKTNPSEVDDVVPRTGETESGRFVTLSLAADVSISNPAELDARTSNLMYMSMSSSDNVYVNPVAPSMAVKEPDGLKPRVQRYE